MAKHSSIEWTHHTFNPWWGCTKVSPACKHCYAETWANRFGLNLWGSKAPRRFFGEQHWREPYRWNQEALRTGVRQRVFCASMADVFEDRRDLDSWRAKLWTVIDETTALDWLLLTKRPECVSSIAPWRDSWPSNVWLGTTVENQRWADKRIPSLLKNPATVRFVSCEPLLGPIDLSTWLSPHTGKLDWVIAGGESGRKARPMNPHWARLLRDQCKNAGVAFHFKQWGHWRPKLPIDSDQLKCIAVRAGEGTPITLVNVSKHVAGRRLDGKTWDQFPTPATFQIAG